MSYRALLQHKRHRPLRTLRPNTAFCQETVITQPVTQPVKHICTHKHTRTQSLKTSKTKPPKYEKWVNALQKMSTKLSSCAKSSPVHFFLFFFFLLSEESLHSTKEREETRQESSFVSRKETLLGRVCDERQKPDVWSLWIIWSFLIRLKSERMCWGRGWRGKEK